jgi:tryptophan synthase alpha chain
MAIRFAEKPGLVIYLTCGDPSPETTRDCALAAIGAGADVIELGVPFSDPVADGPIIQRSSERALKNRTGVAEVLRIAREIRARSDAGLIVFTYLNPILRYGFQDFSKDAAEAGADGVLVTDLPVEEAGEYLPDMHSRGLATVFLAAPTSTDERLAQIAKVSSGFIYAVSRMGVTGTQKSISGDAQELVKRIRKHTKLPIAAGFGVSSPEQLTQMGRFADAVVVGSAVMELVERNPAKAPDVVGQFVRKLLANRRAQYGREL